MSAASASAADLYDWLLFLHIVAAMVWVGGAVLLAVLVTRAVREGPYSHHNGVAQVFPEGQRPHALRLDRRSPAGRGRRARPPK